MSQMRASHLSVILGLILGGLAVSADGQSAPTAADDRARCKAGDLPSCVRSEEARCDAGDAHACVELSRRYYGGVAVGRDQERGKQFFERAFRLSDSACTAGELNRCAVVGMAYGTGFGAPLDAARAKAILERACAGGSAVSCADLGMAYLVGRIGIQRDSVRALQLLEPACASGNANACFQLAYNYEFGRAVAKDPVRAAALYQQACDADAEDAMAKIGRAHV